MYSILYLSTNVYGKMCVAIFLWNNLVCKHFDNAANITHIASFKGFSVDVVYNIYVIQCSVPLAKESKVWDLRRVDFQIPTSNSSLYMT